jgi:hypothetical protein
MNNLKLFYNFTILLLFCLCIGFYQNLLNYRILLKIILRKVESNDISSIKNVSHEYITFMSKNKTNNYTIAYVKKDTTHREPLKFDKIQEIISKQYDKVEEHNKDNELYIEWNCERYCGGWGDRVKLIASSFMLALLMDYRFRVNIKFPCDFKNLFNQKEITFWREPEFNFRKDVKVLNINNLPELYVNIRIKDTFSSF